jgi:hypothetical protein
MSSFAGPSVKSSFFAENVNPSANESLFRCTFGGGFYSTNQNRGVFSKIKTGLGCNKKRKKIRGVMKKIEA